MYIYIYIYMYIYIYTYREIERDSFTRTCVHLVHLGSPRTRP